jgi:hypothetical protein
MKRHQLDSGHGDLGDAAADVRASVRRVYASRDLAELQSRAAGEGRAVAVVMTGETGQIVNTTGLRPNDPGFATRSFSGKVRARKPERRRNQETH